MCWVTRARVEPRVFKHIVESMVESMVRNVVKKTVKSTWTMLLCLLAAAAVHAASPEANLDVPPLLLHEQTLPNGLRVVSLEDHTSPTVAVQVWYQVGSKDDPAHRSGFAHLFEYPMFKSTKNLEGEQFDRLTEDVGGENNAATEVERYRAQARDGLKVAMNDPRELARLVIPQLAYDFEPYRHATSGTPASLARIEPDDLGRLHSTYYRPDHAVLIFAGDIDAAAA